MNKKNVIIIMIDGGRLDYAINSDIFFFQITKRVKNRCKNNDVKILKSYNIIKICHSVFKACIAGF